MAFIINRPDGSAREVSGYRYAAPPAGTKTFAASRPAEKTLPKKVDLRSAMTAVENQRQTNSCAANAVAGAYEYLVKQHLTDEAYDVSRMFIYYNGRAVDQLEAEDGGSVISSLIKSLKEHGACSEETWPFDTDRVNEKPSDEAYDEAKEFLIEDTALVPTDVNAWRGALAEGYPIVFGIKLFESFDKQRKPGMVPMPSAAETGRKSHGGHAMLAVGYSDPDKVFIVRNSWGTGWGQEGYCFIPYDYLCSDTYNNGDSWIIRRIDVVDSEDTWSDDDESVLPELDNEIANMTEEEHQALLDACGGIPLETRIAQLFLLVAGCDGELSEEEMESLASHVKTIMEQLGSSLDPAKVLKYAGKHIQDEGLLEETIALMNDHFSNAMLASILSKAQEIAGSDGTSAEEDEVIAALVEAWQIDEGEEEGEEEEGEGEDDEDEEEDEEDDEDEEDEEDE